jgi:hypothetical protein
VSTSEAAVPEFLRGLVDDAAVFPPGNAPLDDALRANRTLPQRTRHAAVVGTFVIDDRRVPDLARAVRDASEDAVPDLEDPLPVNVVVTGGAGSLSPAVTWTSSAGLGLAGLEVALRDSATGELGHNARRIVAAVRAVVDADDLREDAPVYVEMPRLYGSPPTPDWFEAMDELAAAELRLKLRTGGEDADAFPAPHELAGCIEAALDREMPFKCTAGLHHAVRHHDEVLDADQHGFLNVLLATRAALDGSSVDEIAEVLAVTDPSALTDGLDPDRLTSARRWFRSFGSCSIDEPIADLQHLGLLAEQDTR